MKWILSSFFLIFLSINTWSLPIRTEPLPELKGLESGTLDPDTILGLALILGQVTSQEMVLNMEKSRELLKLSKEEMKELPLDQKGESLLKWLFSKKVFTRYQSNQTRVHTLFETGDYNCVSSALIYLATARNLGLVVNGVETKDHAFCIVETPAGPVDVETTQPLGWNPGARHEFKDQFGKLTGFSYVPPGNYSGRKSISDRQLLGLLVQNLMAENLRLGKSWENIGLAFDRVAIEGQMAKDEINKAFTNYSAFLNQRREYQTGKELMLKLKEVDPASSVLQNLSLTFFNNEIAQYINSKDFTRARIQFEIWERSKLIGLAELKKMDHDIEYGRLAGMIQTMGWTDFQTQLAAVQNKNLLTNSEVTLLVDGVLNNEAVKIFQRQGTRAAWEFLKTLTESQRNLPSVKRTWETTIRNLEVEFHNRFAQAANQKNWVEASRILSEGLALLPGSEMLRRDKTLLK